MRRLAAVPAVLALAFAPVAYGAAPAPAQPVSWAQPQIEAVVSAGLMSSTVDGFRPDDPLTKGELAELVAALGGTASPPPDPSQMVRLRELDATLVRLAGLGPAAKRVRSALVAAGLRPPSRAGTETVARLLGLRLNHPLADELLELLPNDLASRAEAAYSVARLLEAQASGGVASVRAQVEGLALPELTDWQRRVLTRAVRFVGYPYIWGGTSERRQAPFGKEVPGGFDCSGFVWRVYKLKPFPGAPSLAGTLKGRTTYAMSGEVPAELRLPFQAIEPADVIFFGPDGPGSKPGQVGHMGIYLGGGWFVHASTRGTTIVPLSGWYADTFAWARRPLAEAGLETMPPPVSSPPEESSPEESSPAPETAPETAPPPPPVNPPTG